MKVTITYHESATGSDAETFDAQLPEFSGEAVRAAIVRHWTSQDENEADYEAELTLLSWHEAINYSTKVGAFVLGWQNGYFGSQFVHGTVYLNTGV